VYCSLRNDYDNKVLATMSSKNIDKKKNCNKEKARQLGVLFGDNIKKLNIKEIVFDRGRYLYHGKVMAFAEGIREKGIAF
jgi:large subunit ribosomal protein L18